MPGTTIWLYDESRAQTFTLRPESPSSANGLACKTYDLGAPESKENIDERMGRDGVSDNTSLHGRSVARFELELFGTQSYNRFQMLEDLKRFLDPTKRYYLNYKRYGETDVWRAIYRPDTYSCVVGPGSGRIPVSLQLIIPEGVYETPATEYSIRPSGTSVGMSYPFTAPYSFTPSAGTGIATIYVGGSRPVPFRMLMYGYQNSPVISDTDTGRKISFTANGGLNIPAGSYVEIDVEKGTALLNGDPNSSVYQYIDFGVSTWWKLRSEQNNRISVTASDSDGSAEVKLYVASRRF